MEVTQGSTMDFKPIGLNHRAGGIDFKILHLGDEGTPENYGLVLARQRDFYSPVHRHNFDQIRYTIKGDIDLGPGMNLKQGMSSYHPEGAYYGPQKDDGDIERIVMVLQCGGASGQGYLSWKELESANKELSAKGSFVKGKYHGEDGSVVDGFQALWEHKNGRKLEYPKARYQHPILIDPEAFEWKPTGNGVSRRALGVFSERELKVEQLLVKSGTVTVGSDNAIHLLYVLDGTGRVGSEELLNESAIQLQPGTTAEIHGKDLLMLHYELPMLK